MTTLSPGHIAAIAVACSVVSAILAGGMAFLNASRRASRRASRKSPRNTDTPTKFVFDEMSQSLQRCMHLPALGDLTIDVVHSISRLVMCLSIKDPLSPAFIATLKAAVPCDGIIGADWPLWERLLTDTKSEPFSRHRLRDTVLSLLVAHWLVPKMQPDGDEKMTLLPPDFVSLRKRIMAKPQYDSESLLSLNLPPFSP